MTIFVGKPKYLNLNFIPNVVYDMCAKLLQLCGLFETLWTVACQAALSMGFSRQEHWSGLSFLPPGFLPDPGIKPVSLSSALAGRFFISVDTWEVQFMTYLDLIPPCYFIVFICPFI